VAGPDPITQKKAISKKQVKKIATKQINKLAPGLSVAHANTATNADSAQAAANADTLDNLDSGSFAAANRFRFGSADPSATTPQTLFEAGGITVATDGDSDLDSSVRIFNATGGFVEASVEDSTSIQGIASGANGTALAYSTAGRAGTVVMRITTQPQRALLIHCGNDFAPNRLECWGFLSPALAG
jgi:hypothetical protein